jgi:hypothetical protein
VRRPAALAQKWLDRAKASYAGADLDDASDAAKSALQAAPNDVEVKTWPDGALARLDYAGNDAALEAWKRPPPAGCGAAPNGTPAISEAADELEAMLQDPGCTTAGRRPSPVLLAVAWDANPSR